MSFISKCKICDVVCNDKKCSWCGGTKFYLVKEENLGYERNINHYNHTTFDGYPYFYSYDNSIFDKPDLSNKVPRTFPINCNVKQCVWNIWHNNKKNGMGDCDRHEAWNTIEVAELEIDDKTECPWYSGKGRGPTLGSIGARAYKS